MKVTLTTSRWKCEFCKKNPAKTKVQLQIGASSIERYMCGSGSCLYSIVIGSWHLWPDTWLSTFTMEAWTQVHENTFEMQVL